MGSERSAQTDRDEIALTAYRFQMMARRGAVGVLASGLVLALGACRSLFPARYRFRFTVKVDTPQGLRSGASVYEVTVANTGSVLPEGAKRDWQVTGEAVAVDLPGGRTLFALLKTYAHFEDMVSLSMATLYPGFAAEGYDVVGVAKELARGNHPGPVEVAPEDFPLLVTFANKNDPASVALVDPANLAAHFGPNVSLRAITAELTDDPVTTAIAKHLPWLSEFPEPRLDPDYRGGSTNPTLPQALWHSDFRRI